MSPIKSSLIRMGVAIFLLTGCMAILPETGKETHLENDESVKSILYAQLREWQGYDTRLAGFQNQGSTVRDSSTLPTAIISAWNYREPPGANQNRDEKYLETGFSRVISYFSKQGGLIDM